MKRYSQITALWMERLLLVLLLATPAAADIIHADAPGLTLYVRVYTSATTSKAVALTEGTSSGVGFYRVTDANLASAGLSSASWSTYPGGYPYKVFSGAPSETANDPLRGTGTLHWSGSVELASAADAKQIASDSTAASNLDDAFDEAGSSGVDMALQSLAVSNASGTAVSIASTGGNGHGINVSGNGSGKGILVSAGATGIGLAIDGGQTSGRGMYITATDGTAIETVGGNNGHGFLSTGAGSGEGIKGAGGSSGNGFEIDGGATGDDFVLTADDWPGLTTLVDFMLDDGTTAYDRTTDSLQEIRDAVGPSGGGVNVTQWNGTNVATPSVAGVPEVDLTKINGADVSALSGNIDTSNVILETTVGTVTSASVFTLAAGSTVDNAYVGQSIVVYDDSNSDYPWVGTVEAYVGNTKTVTLTEALGFTPATSDEVRIFVGASADYVQAMVTGGPVEHEPVADQNRRTLARRSDGTSGINRPLTQRANESVWYAVNCSSQLGSGKLLDAYVTAPTVSGGGGKVSVGAYGVLGVDAKVRIETTSDIVAGTTATIRLVIIPSVGAQITIDCPFTVLP